MAARLRFEKHLTHPITADKILLCPTLDLVAIATAPSIVEVFRFSGHRAFGTKSNDDVRISALAWKPDGTKLRIQWDDGSSTLLSSNMTSFTTTKVDRTGDENESQAASKHELSPFDWKLQATMLSSESKGRRSQNGHDDMSSSISASSPADGLCKYLDAMDLSYDLPGVAELPPFRDSPLWKAIGSQRLNDTVIREGTGVDSDHIDLLVRGSQDHASIEGTIGACSFAIRLDDVETSQRVTHLSSHASSSSHAVVTEGMTPEAQGVSKGNQVHLHLVSFNSIEQNKRYLGLVGDSCRKLQQWTTFIIHSVDVLRIMWKAGRRALEQQVLNIEDTLAEAEIEGLTLTQQLYQLAFTGACSPQVKTWIAEDMGSQGMTRWYTALGASLQQMLAVCQQQLLPALEHATLEAINLRSLSNHEEDSQPVRRTDVKLLTALVDDLDTLRLVATSISRYIADQAHQTYIFSDWLMQYQAMLEDPTSTAAKEAERKIAETDYPQLHDFILNGINKNPLNIFLGRPTDQILAAQRRPKLNPMRVAVDMMLKRHAGDYMQPKSPVLEYVNLLYLALFVDDTSKALMNELCLKINLANTVTGPLIVKKTNVEHFADLLMASNMIYGVSHSPSSFSVHTWDVSGMEAEASSTIFFSEAPRGQTIACTKFCSRGLLVLLVSTTSAIIILRPLQQLRQPKQDYDIEKATLISFEHSAASFRPKDLVVGKNNNLAVLAESGRDLRVYDLGELTHTR